MEVSKRALRDELIALEDASRDVRTLFRSRETTVGEPNVGEETYADKRSSPRPAIFRDHLVGTESTGRA